MEINELKEISKKIRKQILSLSHKSNSPHIACSLSCVDIFSFLYFHEMNLSDKFIMSKGHGCMAYYATLYEKKIITLDYLNSYGVDGGKLSKHPSNHIPGVDVSTGSLGHGLSIGAGRALARKILKKNGREFVLLGDGECNEGSIWEAVMFASYNKLDNLIAIVDNNKFQAMDRCKNILNSDLSEMFRSFGWNVVDVDGNNLQQLLNINMQQPNRPTLINAHTIKGSGVSFMENNLDWHYKAPNKEEYELAMKEVENA